MSWISTPARQTSPKLRGIKLRGIKQQSALLTNMKPDRAWQEQCVSVPHENSLTGQLGPQDLSVRSSLAGQAHAGCRSLARTISQGSWLLPTWAFPQGYLGFLMGWSGSKAKRSKRQNASCRSLKAGPRNWESRLL